MIDSHSSQLQIRGVCSTQLFSNLVLAQPLLDHFGRDIKYLRELVLDNFLRKVTMVPDAHLPLQNDRPLDELPRRRGTALETVARPSTSP